VPTPTSSHGFGQSGSSGRSAPAQSRTPACPCHRTRRRTRRPGCQTGPAALCWAPAARAGPAPAPRLACSRVVDFGQLDRGRAQVVGRLGRSQDVRRAHSGQAAPCPFRVYEGLTGVVARDDILAHHDGLGPAVGRAAGPPEYSPRMPSMMNIFWMLLGVITSRICWLSDGRYGLHWRRAASPVVHRSVVVLHPERDDRSAVRPEHRGVDLVVDELAQYPARLAVTPLTFRATVVS